MSKGPDHYLASQEWLRRAKELYRASDHDDDALSAGQLAASIAQVHATLAHAAATAEFGSYGPASTLHGPAIASSRADAWDEVLVDDPTGQARATTVPTSEGDHDHDDETAGDTMQEAYEAGIDVDLQMAELCRLGDAVAAVRRAGRCAHQSAAEYRRPAVCPEQQGLRPGQLRCMDGCEMVFDTEQDWYAAMDEAV